MLRLAAITTSQLNCFSVSAAILLEHALHPVRELVGGIVDICRISMILCALYIEIHSHF